MLFGILCGFAIQTNCPAPGNRESAILALPDIFQLTRFASGAASCGEDAESICLIVSGTTPLVVVGTSARDGTHFGRAA